MIEQAESVDLLPALMHIGAIQFGQFESKDRPGTFDPIAIRFGLLPSYPSILRALAGKLVPLVRREPVTHLLASPTAVPLGVAVSLAADMPLVYPAAGDAQTIEGAYDYNVPTTLITDVLTDGDAERALIKWVRSIGLEVKAVVAVLSLGVGTDPDGQMNVTAWRCLPDLLPQIATAPMQTAVQEWLLKLNHPVV